MTPMIDRWYRWRRRRALLALTLDDWRHIAWAEHLVNTHQKRRSHE